MNAAESLLSAQKSGTDVNVNPESATGIVSVPGSIQITVETSSAPENKPPEDSAQERHRSVRFRSRVRITSGLHHHRHKRQKTAPEEPLRPNSLSFPIAIQHKRLSTEDSVDSSLSSSPSSSISAPLRREGDPDDTSRKSRLGPLGQRINFFRRQAPARTRYDAEHGTGEHTSLMSGRPRAYVTLNDENWDSEDEEDAAAYDSQSRLSREIDEVFGKWPGRLLNRHWWWWQLEPVVRCNCLDESDTEPEDM